MRKKIVLTKENVHGLEIIRRIIDQKTKLIESIRPQLEEFTKQRLKEKANSHESGAI